MSAFCHSASTLCLSALLVLSVNYHMLFFLIRVKTNRWEWAVSQAVCSSYHASLWVGIRYTQFVCCLLGSKTRRVSSRGRDLREHLSMRMLYFQRVLLRGSLHQHSSRCQHCFRWDRPATALAGIADKTTPVPAALNATPVFIRGGGCGGCR